MQRRTFLKLSSAGLFTLATSSPALTAESLGNPKEANNLIRFAQILKEQPFVSLKIEQLGPYGHTAVITMGETTGARLSADDVHFLQTKSLLPVFTPKDFNDNQIIYSPEDSKEVAAKILNKLAGTQNNIGLRNS